MDIDRVPRVAGSRFRPGFPLLWIEGRDPIAGAPVWLPFELVHANYTLSRGACCPEGAARWVYTGGVPGETDGSP